MLGFSEGGSRLPRFINSDRMAKYVGPELQQKLQKPVVFQGPLAGPNAATMINGYDVTLLIDLCKAIIAAKSDGALQPRHDAIAIQAQIIVNASAKLGIKSLVYALAGYRPEIEEVIQSFKVFVQEEAKKYEAEFPKELYMAWQRLYKIPLPDRGKPWQFMHLTRRHIYWPLANSSGKILDLLRALRAKDGEQKRYLFQFLNVIGARALRIHMGRVLEMAETSSTPAEYEAKIVARFGGQQELDLVVPGPDRPDLKAALSLLRRLLRRAFGRGLLLGLGGRGRNLGRLARGLAHHIQGNLREVFASWHGRIIRLRSV